MVTDGAQRVLGSQSGMATITQVMSGIAHDRSKEFHWKFNPSVAARMIQLQNPLLRFHKTTKGNFSGEDFQISPTVSFLDDSDTLAQVMPYKTDRSCLPLNVEAQNNDFGISNS